MVCIPRASRDAIESGALDPGQMPIDERPSRLGNGNCRNRFVRMGIGNETEHLVGPGTADVDDAAPDLTGFPISIVRLIVFESHIERDCDADCPQRSDRNAAINTPFPQPQKQEGHRRAPGGKHNYFPKRES